MNRLKELRKEKKLSQKEIADFLGVNEKTISRWEKGDSAIKSDKAQQLADSFEVSVLYLMGYDHTEKAIADLKKELVDAIKEIKQYRLLKVGLDDYIAEKDVLDVIDEILD